MAYTFRNRAAYAVLAIFNVVCYALSPSAITINNPAFKKLLGLSPEIIELTRTTSHLYHEAGAYHAPTKSLWVNSAMIVSDNTTTRYTFRITGLESPNSLQIERINHSIPNPIGGVPSIRSGPLGDILLFVAQGTLKPTPPAGIYALNPYPPYNSSLVLGSYGDYPFNSPDDITITSDSTIWISDPPYGYYGECNRPLPVLPNQVYSFHPSTNDSRVVADGFGRPNGMAANDDGTKVSIGDTGANIGNGTTDYQGSRTIYAYDRCGSFLTNRHVFAMPQGFASAPDGIKVDTQGNVWAGVAGEGLVVWSFEGTLLGSIKLKGTIGNLGFGTPGELFVLGGNRIYKIKVSSKVIGVGVE